MVPEAVMFTVRGLPRAQPRPRFFGRRVVSTTGPASRWREAVRRAASEAGRAAGGMPWLEGPVSVDMRFTFPTPKAERWGQPHTVKPDLDNLAKLVLDAMAEARLVAKDQRVAGGTWSKAWGVRGELVITIRPAGAMAEMMAAVRSAPVPGWMVEAAAAELASGWPIGKEKPRHEGGV